jgi:hypothetical protein
VATLDFEIPTRRVIVPIGTTEVLIQEIHDQCRDFSDSPAMAAIPHIVESSGKETLNAATGKKVGITTTLVNDWRLYAEPRPGPSWDLITVTGGNLVAVNIYGNDPIENTTYANWVIELDSSAAIVETGVSGLTAAEALDLRKIRQAMLNAQRIAEGDTDNFEIWDDGDDPDVDPPLYTQDLTDKDGNPIVLPEGAPARRTEAT